MAPRQTDEEQPLVVPAEQSAATLSAQCESFQRSAANGDNGNHDGSAHSLLPQITRNHWLLLLVAILYGTLNVSLRAVYHLPDPPSACELSTVRGWLAVLCFVPLVLFGSHSQPQEQPQEEEQEQQSSSFTTLPLQPPPPPLASEIPPPTIDIGLVQAAVELAVWNFGAQALVNIGLTHVLAARAAFLCQLSVVMTPMVSALAGHHIGNQVWWACGIALCGLILLSNKGGTSTDTTTTTATSKSSGLDFTLSFGDLLCLMGALSWSIYLFRVSAIGKDAHYNEVTLQALKNVFLAGLYTLWFLVEHVFAQQGQGHWLGGWSTNIVAWGWLFYSALGPGTIADVVQQKAQMTVMATVANILLSSEPVFTAIFGRILLGEWTTWSEKMGGCFILLAAVVATR